MIDLKLKTKHCQICNKSLAECDSTFNSSMNSSKKNIIHRFYIRDEYQNYDYFNSINKIYLAYFYDFEPNKGTFYFIKEPCSNDVLFEYAYYAYDCDLKFNSFEEFEKFIIDLYNKYLENSIFG